MRLKNCVYLILLELTAVVDCVLCVSIGMLAHRTEITLAPLARNTRVCGFDHNYRVGRASLLGTRLIFCFRMIVNPTFP